MTLWYNHYTAHKIDEPKTPYTEYDYHSDTESVSSAIGLRRGSIDDHNNSSSFKTSGGLVDSVKLRQGQLNWDDITTKLQAVVDTREAGVGLTQSASVMVVVVMWRRIAKVRW